MLTVREEQPGDLEAIRAVNEQAFGQLEESRIVDSLRENEGVVLSLVATQDDVVVGHILFSSVSIDDGGEEVRGAGLAPMAVRPEYQRQGVGTALVESGRQKLADLGCPFIVVLGHPDYYPKFGFTPASRQGLHCEWDVPDNVFMLLVLDEEKMADVSGLAKYRDEFANDL